MQIFAGQVRMGIHAGPQHTTYSDYVNLWKTAEDLGYDWASVFDHFAPIAGDAEGPCFEGLSLLAALAAQTSRIRCGILVIGNTYRNPGLLANTAATIDHISGGRLELGIGAGWYELDHEMYGIPFHTVGRRIRMLGESAKVLRSLFTNHRSSFKGRYYELDGALCEPKPLQQQLPLWVGGAGEQLTLRVVAESADGWNTFFMPVEEYQHKLDVLAEHCKAVGRNPEDIRKSLVLSVFAGETEAEAQQRAGAAAQQPRPPVMGTPQQIVEQLMPYVRLGVGDFIIGARPPADLRNLELIAQQVMPLLKQQGAPILAARS